MTAGARRPFAVACVAVLAATALAGCAPGGSGSDDPAAVEAEFLAALSAGDGEAALALTTTARSDLDCPDLITDYGTLSSGIAGAEAGSAKTDGDTATVSFTYSVVTNAAEAVESSGSHTLVRDDGRWLIQLPDDYRLSATLPADTVAESSVGGSAENTGACAGAVSDGAVDIVALPGAYDLDVRDPTGVFGAAAFSTTEIVVVDGADDPVEIAYPDDAAREQVATEIRNALVPLVEECATTDFTSSSCPAGLPAVDGSVVLSPRPSERFTDFPTVTKIFSDDGQTWRFTAGGQSFTFSRGGVAETVPMDYAGAVTSAADGTVELVLD